MEKADIICVLCKERVGYIYPNKCELPLRGYMINKHLGCESWPLPLPDQGPLDFTCPHSWDGDLHTFINYTEGKHEEADTFLGADHKPIRIFKVSGTCPCGCGGRVREGNKYADNLTCYRQHVAKLKAEIEDGNSED